MPQPAVVEPTVARRALLAGCVGNLVEWYDFALYGAFATTIAATFFPDSAAGGGLVATFAVFGVSFLARPVGALAFGHVGDRVGRRRSLTASLLLMAVATAGLGLLPGYDRIGWLAPLLLVVLRLAQGVAVGGEYASSAALVVEYAPERRRGLYGGWQYATVGFGLASGIAVAAITSAAAPAGSLQAPNWRLPFLAALPLGLVGLYVRMRLEEPPPFRAMRDAGSRARHPVAEALRIARPDVVRGFATVGAVSLVFNLFYVFLPGHLAATRGVPLRDALGAATIGLVMGSAAAPVFGRWSDRIGRRPVLIGGLSAMVVVIGPTVALTNRGDPASLVAGYVLVAVPLGALALSAWLAESFPTRVRTSGLSLTYGMATALFGGTMPLVAVAVARQTGSLRVAVGYGMVVTVAALVLVVRGPETAHRRLDAETD